MRRTWARHCKTGASSAVLTQKVRHRYKSVLGSSDAMICCRKKRDVFLQNSPSRALSLREKIPTLITAVLGLPYGIALRTTGGKVVAYTPYPLVRTCCWVGGGTA